MSAAELSATIISTAVGECGACAPVADDALDADVEPVADVEPMVDEVIEAGVLELSEWNEGYLSDDSPIEPRVVIGTPFTV